MILSPASVPPESDRFNTTLSPASVEEPSVPFNKIVPDSPSTFVPQLAPDEL